STTSPWRRVPFCTSTVAIGPRPLSRRDSMTTPRAGASGWALSSSTSACSSTASSSSSIPVPTLADTWTNMVSPPHSSGMTSRAARSFLMRSGSACSLSILFTATTRGTPAALACCTASSVCGITPSSAATTRLTMSVDLAAGTHRSKGRVTGGIEEGDHAAVGFHVGGTDVLGNATGFAGGNAGTADVVEQRGLAMVNVTHDGNHGGAGDFLALVLHGLGQTVFQIAFLDLLDLVTHVFCDDGRGV